MRFLDPTRTPTLSPRGEDGAIAPTRAAPSGAPRPGERRGSLARATPPRLPALGGALARVVLLGLLPIPSPPALRADEPRNVILMVGDGMGLNQLASAYYLKGSLAVSRMRTVGLSRTHSLRNFVTDSSAGATALASGYVIVNGEVGVGPSGAPIKLIVQYAEEEGRWTGLASTSRITHATPASMVCHVKSRESELEIAEQIAASNVDVILGGGWDQFLPQRSKSIGFEEEPLVEGGALANRGFLTSVARSAGSVALAAEAPLLWNGSPYGVRTDGKDLVADMQKRGYTFVRTAPELALIAEGPPRRVLGLFHSGGLPRASEGRSPSLPALSLAALRILSQAPDGFFLMIEGSQIDWGGHANDFEYMQGEAADFDDAIGAVIGFLEETGLADETLLVVTADHETGGLALNSSSALPLGFEPKWTTDYHTGAPVPVFAIGPGQERFAGFTSHPAVGRALIESVVRRKVEFAYPIDGGYPGLRSF